MSKQLPHPPAEIHDPLDDVPTIKLSERDSGILDRQMDDDREWFEQNPHRMLHLRPATMAEIDPEGRTVICKDDAVLVVRLAGLAGWRFRHLISGIPAPKRKRLDRSDKLLRKLLRKSLSSGKGARHASF